MIKLTLWNGKCQVVFSSPKKVVFRDEHAGIVSSKLGINRKLVASVLVSVVNTFTEYVGCRIPIHTFGIFQ